MCENHAELTVTTELRYDIILCYYRVPSQYLKLLENNIRESVTVNMSSAEEEEGKKKIAQEAKQ